MRIKYPRKHPGVIREQSSFKEGSLSQVSKDNETKDEGKYSKKYFYLTVHRLELVYSMASVTYEIEPSGIASRLRFIPEISNYIMDEIV